MFIENQNVVMTTQRILKYIEVFKQKYLPRLQKLSRYYNCQNDAILNRTFSDNTIPNNHIAVPFGKYICDVTASYFVGKPIVLNSTNTEYLSELNSIFKYNDSQVIDNQLALNQSKYGLANELLYIDNQKNIRFAPIDVENTILIYDNTVEKNLIYAIRFFEETDILTNKKTLSVELYSETDISYFTEIEGVLTLTDMQPHFFGGCPINPYINNTSSLSDFEHVIKLIDSYDYAISDQQNMRDSWADSYMLWKNTGELKVEEALVMKEKKNIFVEDKEQGMASDVSYLNKNADVTEINSFLDRIADNIFTFSYVNNLNSESQKSHTSATQSKLSLMALEQNVIRKEAYFKFGLQRKIELITNILNIKGAEYNYLDIAMTFTRNIPIDLSVVSDTIVKLRNLVSDQTLLENLPIISDVEQELQRIQKQNELNSYANLFSNMEGDVVEQ